jgi:hypothetical protein
MDWLDRAFGFRERLRVTDAEGSVAHAEMELGEAVIMLGSPAGYQSAAHLGQVTSSVYVRIEDLDGHYRQAVAAGAGNYGHEEPFKVTFLGTHAPRLPGSSSCPSSPLPPTPGYGCFQSWRQGQVTGRVAACSPTPGRSPRSRTRAEH